MQHCTSNLIKNSRTFLFVRRFTSQLAVELTWSYDDNGAEKSNFCIRQAKMVHSLGQLEYGVHKELCVSRRHGIDGVLPDDVSIKTNQALQHRLT